MDEADILAGKHGVSLQRPCGTAPEQNVHVRFLRKRGFELLLLLYGINSLGFFFLSSDRKAFMSHGRLKCVGSSLFLKKKWGIGYHLRYLLLSQKRVSGKHACTRSHQNDCKGRTVEQMSSKQDN